MNNTNPNNEAQSPVSSHGGKRLGAGRKPKVIAEGMAKAHLDAVGAVAKAASEAMGPLVQQAIGDVPLVVAVATARKRIGGKYPEILDALFALIESNEQVSRKYEPAGLITVDEWTDPDEKGKQLKVKRQLFPNRAPDEMVLVCETIVTYPPDAAVAQFLFNRLAGKPAEEKTDPLTDAPTEGAKVATREEMYADLLDMMFARWEERNAPQPATVPSAPALPAPEGIIEGQGSSGNPAAA
ncbi:MAG: hypothetical protein ACRYFS_21170 [Janthinobacterium lividum]